MDQIRSSCSHDLLLPTGRCEAKDFFFALLLLLVRSSALFVAAGMTGGVSFFFVYTL
jgi:hypothetical protein